jgi:hypothetical protein
LVKKIIKKLNLSYITLIENDLWGGGVYSSPPFRETSSWSSARNTSRAASSVIPTRFLPADGNGVWGDGYMSANTLSGRHDAEAYFLKFFSIKMRQEMVVMHYWKKKEKRKKKEREKRYLVEVEEGVGCEGQRASYGPRNGDESLRVVGQELGGPHHRVSRRLSLTNGSINGLFEQFYRIKE